MQVLDCVGDFVPESAIGTSLLFLCIEAWGRVDDRVGSDISHDVVRVFLVIPARFPGVKEIDGENFSCEVDIEHC